MMTRAAKFNVVISQIHSSHIIRASYSQKQFYRNLAASVLRVSPLGRRAWILFNILYVARMTFVRGNVSVRVILTFDFGNSRKALLLFFTSIKFSDSKANIVDRGNFRVRGVPSLGALPLYFISKFQGINTEG